MKLQIFEYYLIVVNIIGFILFIINTWLYTNTEKGQIDKILTITSLLGGSLGILISILIFDKYPKKETMMSRVFVACVLVIQIVIFLIIEGYIGKNITLEFWKILNEHRYILRYLEIINVITFIAYGIDKLAAIKNKTRIRIVTLLGLAFIGGSLGALLAMYIFKHKTSKDYFTTGIWLIILMQILVLFYLSNIT